MMSKVLCKQSRSHCRVRVDVLERDHFREGTGIRVRQGGAMQICKVKITPESESRYEYQVVSYERSDAKAPFY